MTNYRRRRRDFRNLEAGVTLQLLCCFGQGDGDAISEILRRIIAFVFPVLLAAGDGDAISEILRRFQNISSQSEGC